MSTYQELKGLKVKYLSADTSGDRVKEGEIFYNSSAFTIGSHISIGAWHSAPNMSQARRSCNGFGIQTAAVIVGGDNGAGTFFYRDVEEYNGVGFSAGTNIPQMGAPSPSNYLGITDAGQAGTQTAGLYFGGESYTRSGSHTAEYDGSSWTITGNMNNLRRGTGCGGTQTAAFACGGYDGSNRAYTENYNGNSWTTSGAMNTAMMCSNGRANLAPQTAGLVFGGSVVPGDTTRTTTEEYDGSSWAVGGALNNATVNASGGGTQTAGLKFAGGPPENSTISSTENYDGSSWTTGTNMGTIRRQTAGLGSQTAALAAGGRTSSNLATAEEYDVSVSTITAAAWSSSDSLNTARFAHGSADQGPTSAALVFGGTTGGPNITDTEEYNGTSWSEQNNLGTGRYYFAGSGTQTAGLGFGGYASGGGTKGDTEEYDGTSWSEQNDLNTARYGIAGCGAQTATIAFGGISSPPFSTNASEQYNGTSWTATPNLNTAGQGIFGFGTSSAAIAATRYSGPPNSVPNYPTATESWNGSTWTTTPATTVTARRFGGAAGTATDAIIFGGGQVTTLQSVTEGYDGSAWSSRPSMATARFQLPGNGSSTAAFATGGANPPSGQKSDVEEFNGEIETATAKTIDFD